MDNSLRYAPLLSGVMLPLCCLFNVQALLVQGWLWKAPKWDGGDEEDPGAIVYYHPLYLKFLLAFALTSGVIACAALFLRCSMLVETTRRKRATWVMIWSGLLQSFLLFVLIAIFLLNVVPLPYETYFTQGFFYSLASGLFSVMASTMRAYDVMTRTKRNRWGLSDQQTQLILLVIFFVSYLIVGSVLFSTLERWTFDDAVYWSVVTFSTIGFGDFVPKTSVGRGLTPLYAAGGILAMGGLIYGIREVVLEYMTFSLAASFSHELVSEKKQGYWDQLAKAVKSYTWSNPQRESQPLLQNQQSSYGTIRHQSLGSLSIPDDFVLKRSGSVSVTAPYRSRITGRQKRRTFSISGPTRQEVPNYTQTSIPIPVPFTREPETESPLSRSAPETSSPIFPTPSQMFESTISVRQGSQMMTGSGLPSRQITPTSEEVRDKRIRFADSPERVRTRSAISDTEEARRLIRLKRSKSLPEVNIQTDWKMKKRDVVAVTVRALNQQLMIGLALLTLHLTIFGFLFAWMEDWNWEEGVYFCFVSIATIGYGDFYPTKSRSRNIFLLYVFLGIPNLTFLGSVLAERLSNQWRVHVETTGVLDADEFTATDTLESTVE